MPQLGETVAEGKITKWFKSAGDAVKPGDNLFEIETDKVSMEVPSTAGGVLTEIRVRSARWRRSARWLRSSADAGTAPARNRRGATAPQPPKARLRPGVRQPLPQRRQLRPRRGERPNRSSSTHFSRCARPSAISARRKSRRHSASRRWRDGSPRRPASIFHGSSGSGPPGRIVARDIETAGRAPYAARTLGPTARAGQGALRDAPFEEVPLDGMRRTIASRLMQAKQTIPHFYLTADIEVGAAMRCARRRTPRRRGREGRPAFKLSVNDFVIRAWAAALQRGAGRECRVGRGSHPALQRVPISASPSRSRAG